MNDDGREKKNNDILMPASQSDPKSERNKRIKIL